MHLRIAKAENLLLYNLNFPSGGACMLLSLQDVDGAA
jgi:hypothetical protein